MDSLKQPTDKWDTLIHFIVTKTLEWEKFNCEKEHPTWEEFKPLLKSHSDLLETLETNQYTQERKTG